MNAWSNEYGEFILCIAACLSLVALALVRWIDKYHAEQSNYIRSKRK